MQSLFANGSILVNGVLRDDRAVLIEDGLISAVCEPAAAPAGVQRIDLDGAILAPGFIDTQVNGGGGVLFNDAPTPDAIATIGAAHRKFGTTGFLPTLISDDLAVIRDGIEAVEAAIEMGVPGVLGIHIEGPFLNRERKGIHRAEKIQALGEDGLRVLTSMRRGRTLVTLAPECTTPDMVRRLTAAGVVVAAGHSDATYAEALSAMDAGVTGITHLFNAMSPLASREPGMVGAALERDECYCGIIVDGVHVSPPTLRLALRCKPADRFMLVTDAMPSVGAAAKDFVLQGKPISVRDGICRDADGILAGSDLDMATAVRNVVAMLGQPVEAALAMASAVPARFAHLAGELGTIEAGKRANLVVLGRDLRCEIAGSTANALPRTRPAKWQFAAARQSLSRWRLAR